jgi:hypothetical protein
VSVEPVAAPVSAVQRRVPAAVSALAAVEPATFGPAVFEPEQETLIHPLAKLPVLLRVVVPHPAATARTVPMAVQSRAHALRQEQPVSRSRHSAFPVVDAALPPQVVAAAVVVRSKHAGPVLHADELSVLPTLLALESQSLQPAKELIAKPAALETMVVAAVPAVSRTELDAEFVPAARLMVLWQSQAADYS